MEIILGITSRTFENNKHRGASDEGNSFNFLSENVGRDVPPE